MYLVTKKYPNILFKFIKNNRTKKMTSYFVAILIYFGRKNILTKY